MPVAIVTGSDSGIGKATAVILAEQGWDVGITWHEDEQGARGTADEVRAAGRRAEVRRLDLTEVEHVQDVIGSLADALNGVNALVNNAGTGASKPVLEVDLEEWRQVNDTDQTGAYLAAQDAARRMVEQGDGGRIVNVTSVHEHVPKSGSSAYCAAKGGLGLLTKVMALELAEHGITVNAVAPGEIATPMTHQEDEDVSAEDRPAIPAGRPGDAREIGAVVAFLCSPQASYATGASFVIDGGMLLMAAEANALVQS
jgi:NAD(P)-dependent dehydrogenase (short-subunit alcohol dehydrogenase family)